jgi:hypothetical protein
VFSVVCDDDHRWVKTAVAVSFKKAVSVAASIVMDSANIAAFDAGTFPRIPIPKEATSASARRLNFVLVDIVFLSIVVTETFSITAGEEKFFTS